MSKTDKKHICPACGRRLEFNSSFVALEISALTTPKMEWGDLTICEHCYKLLIFDSNLKLRLMDENELSLNMRQQVAGLRAVMQAWKQ